jgi:hypothetical protein
MAKWILLAVVPIMSILSYIFIGSEKTNIGSKKDKELEHRESLNGSEEIDKSLPFELSKREKLIEKSLKREYSNRDERRESLYLIQKRDREQRAVFEKKRKEREFKLSQQRRLYEHKQRLRERSEKRREQKRLIAYKRERERFINGSRPLKNRQRQLFIEEKRQQLLKNRFFEKRSKEKIDESFK